MDFTSLNRIAVAIALTAGAGLLCWEAGSFLVPDTAPLHPAVTIPHPESKPSTAPAKQETPPADLAQEGAKIASVQCAMCHTFTADSPDTVGPSLWGVGARHIASKNGYSYSDALTTHKGERWTKDTLSAWLTNPGEFAPGTRMMFPGVSDENTRARIIAWLLTLGATTPDSTKAPQTEKTHDVSPPPPAGNAEHGAALGQQQCAMCHSFDPDGPAIVGPPLHDIFGRQVAAFTGYTYSDAIKGVKGSWTPDQLDAWLKDPGQLAPGTKMMFPGVSSQSDRDDIIAWLKTLAAQTPKAQP
ncbi:MAG: c-type cytochrome [Acetobacter sp.]|jgi:cytochrome c